MKPHRFKKGDKVRLYNGDLATIDSCSYTIQANKRPAGGPPQPEDVPGYEIKIDGESGLWFILDSYVELANKT